MEVSEGYDGVIRVDLGVRWVATSVALSSSNTEFHGEEIRRIRRHHHDLHTRLQEKGAYDTLQSVKAKEYRRVNDRLHKISRAIVEEAKERNALIVVGNLEGIQNRDLGAVCEPALEPSGADQASATVRFQADLEAPVATKRAVRRAK
ncbi:IS200/IS605 family accessory protein TnpB-related protein [Natrialba swarupiae]|uniref:IS200/IS605 family accessory protein TnpB-related protein n=1 Tax=Natrialba swarupiae TaxID=2448032 RepID=UPI001391EC26|nr:IS200/IS605 family accessory protein TnpB-related protein [Natrialba swarupiae]